MNRTLTQAELDFGKIVNRPFGMLSENEQAILRTAGRQGLHLLCNNGFGGVVTLVDPGFLPDNTYTIHHTATVSQQKDYKPSCACCRKKAEEEWVCDNCHKAISNDIDRVVYASLALCPDCVVELADAEEAFANERRSSMTTLSELKEEEYYRDHNGYVYMVDGIDECGDVHVTSLRGDATIYVNTHPVDEAKKIEVTKMVLVKEAWAIEHGKGSE